MTPAENVKARMTPREPVPTGVVSRLTPVEGIRLVIFDIYGTLIISAAGDISLVSESESAKGMAEAIRKLGGGGTDDEVETGLECYRAEILRRQNDLRSQGVEFPEVEIREVWKSIASQLKLPGERIESAALAYECAVNPCWEMPGAGKVIRTLRKNSFPLGIISNAQFYTGAVVEGVSGINLSGADFEPTLSVYSYREGFGKPSRQLFEKALREAEALGIQSQEVLYIGNDLVKDIEPAVEVGFRTGLFAGDQRSLRTGAMTVEEACGKADVVLTELIQLPEVLRLNE